MNSDWLKTAIPRTAAGFQLSFWGITPSRAVRSAPFGDLAFYDPALHIAGYFDVHQVQDGRSDVHQLQAIYEPPPMVSARIT